MSVKSPLNLFISHDMNMSVRFLNRFSIERSLFFFFYRVDRFVGYAWWVQENGESAQRNLHLHCKTRVKKEVSI